MSMDLLGGKAPRPYRACDQPVIGGYSQSIELHGHGRSTICFFFFKLPNMLDLSSPDQPPA